MRPVVDVSGEGAASDPQGFHLPRLTRRPSRGRARHVGQPPEGSHVRRVGQGRGVLRGRGRCQGQRQDRRDEGCEGAGTHEGLLKGVGGVEGSSGQAETRHTSKVPDTDAVPAES